MTNIDVSDAVKFASDTSDVVFVSDASDTVFVCCEETSEQEDNKLFIRHWLERIDRAWNRRGMGDPEVLLSSVLYYQPPEVHQLLKPETDKWLIKCYTLIRQGETLAIDAKLPVYRPQKRPVYRPDLSKMSLTSDIKRQIQHLNTVWYQYAMPDPLNLICRYLKNYEEEVYTLLKPETAVWLQELKFRKKVSKATEEIPVQSKTEEEQQFVKQWMHQINHIWHERDMCDPETTLNSILMYQPPNVHMLLKPETDKWLSKCYTLIARRAMMTDPHPTLYQPVQNKDDELKSVIYHLERLSKIWNNQGGISEPAELLCRYLKYEPSMYILLKNETVAWLHKCNTILEKISTSL